MKDDCLHKIRYIASKELPYIYGVMFDSQTVKEKKCNPPRMNFYIIFNAYKQGVDLYLGSHVSQGYGDGAGM